MNKSLPIAALALLLAATTVAAAPVALSGTIDGRGGVAPDATCAPLPLRATVLPANTVGASNLGAFTYGQAFCTAGGVGPFSGTFSIFYAADMFSGSFTGVASGSGTPGLINETFTYLVTGGTGRFLGGSGSFTGTGTIDTRIPPPRLQLDLVGELNLPAVPEPASWALMIVGFGAVGAAARRRRVTLAA